MAVGPLSPNVCKRLADVSRTDGMCSFFTRLMQCYYYEFGFLCVFGNEISCFIFVPEFYIFSRYNIYVVQAVFLIP